MFLTLCFAVLGTNILQIFMPETSPKIQTQNERRKQMARSSKERWKWQRGSASHLRNERVDFWEGVIFFDATSGGR